ncbi:MAG: hypothetical protein AABW56_05550 [Nanoarchaeota archaeon]
MKKELVGVLLLMVMISPLISADLITPGFHSVPLTNQITNINDFPDYVFVSYAKAGDQACMVGARIQVISNGEIEQVYKMCTVSVYAIKKVDFNETQLMREIKSYEDDYEDYQRFVWDFLNSDKSTEVIVGIITDKTFPVSSTIKSIDNYYTIDFNQVKTKPDKTVTYRNNLIYVYIILPIIALLIILLIIIKRKK